MLEDILTFPDIGIYYSQHGPFDDHYISNMDILFSLIQSLNTFIIILIFSSHSQMFVSEQGKLSKVKGQ